MAKTAEQGTLRAALRRVGMQPAQRFQWLLRFVNDREVPSASKLEQRRWELLAFIFAGWPDYDSEAEPISLDGNLADALLGRPSLRERTPDRAVKRLHEVAVELLAELAVTGSFQANVRIKAARWVRGKNLLLLPASDDESRFRFALLAMLNLIAPRLRRCPASSCEQPLFLASRRYCSPRCSQRARSERYQQRHPERVRQSKRQTYLRRRQRQHPGVRVTSRLRARSTDSASRAV